MAVTGNFRDGNDNRNGPQKMIYLNNAAQARLDPRVEQAGIEALRRERIGEGIPPDTTTRIRQLFSTLIGASDASTIAITPSTAFCMTLVANNMYNQWTTQQNVVKGRILILEDQFNSAVYPWQRLCDLELRKDGHLRLDVVPCPDFLDASDSWTCRILQSLEKANAEADPILVACIPPLHWSDGSLIDLEVVGVECRKQNIPLVVDATQAAGILPISVGKIKPTALCSSVHKWLRCTSGVSLLYVDPATHNVWEPLDQHERARDLPNPSIFDAQRHPMDPTTGRYPEDFLPGARRFDAGGKPHPLILPMLHKSLEIIVTEIDVGVAQSKMQAEILPLVRVFIDNVNRRNRECNGEAPLQFVMPPEGQCAGHMFGIRSLLPVSSAESDSSLTPEKMMEICSDLRKKHNVCITARCGGFRISPYIDTTIEEIQTFLCIFSSYLETPSKTGTIKPAERRD
jgi:kynureninase